LIALIAAQCATATATASAAHSRGRAAPAARSSSIPAAWGVARVAIDPDNTVGEFAIVVRSDLKGKGLGVLLMEALIGYGRARGLWAMVGVAPGNKLRMHALARRLGLAVGAGAGGMVEMRLVLNTPQAAWPLGSAEPRGRGDALAGDFHDRHLFAADRDHGIGAHLRLVAFGAGRAADDHDQGGGEEQRFHVFEDVHVRTPFGE
jgi:hypothetical protein